MTDPSIAATSTMSPGELSDVEHALALADGVCTKSTRMAQLREVQRQVSRPWWIKGLPVDQTIDRHQCCGRATRVFLSLKADGHGALPYHRKCVSCRRHFGSVS